MAKTTKKTKAKKNKLDKMHEDARRRPPSYAVRKQLREATLNGKPATKQNGRPKPAAGAYRLTGKELPPGAGGQRRAVYKAIKAGAADAAAVREAVRGSEAFKGASDTTLKNNAAWHVVRLRRDGFIAKGGKK